jgi:hypothetical protein
MSKHTVGEIGTDLILDTGVLIGSATSQYIKYRKPDGITEGSWAASLYSSYSLLADPAAIGTYFLKHTIASGDFDTPGEWRFQAFIGTSTGTWFGEAVKETIYDKFEI